MRIITDMDLPLKGGCVLSLGNFDGVHIGHTALLEAACKKAKELGLPSVVWTFGEAPLNVLRGKSSLKYITGSSDKIRLLSAVGCDAVYFADFQQYRDCSPEDFVRRVNFIRTSILSTSTSSQNGGRSWNGTLFSFENRLIAKTEYIGCAPTKAVLEIN